MSERIFYAAGQYITIEYVDGLPRSGPYQRRREAEIAQEAVSRDILWRSDE
jgi:hypothetical protein